MNQMQLQLQKQKTSNCEIDFNNVLGKGGFGIVYKGKFRNQEGRVIDVAVKELKRYFNRNQENQYYQQEVDCSLFLSQLRNDHIVQILEVYSPPGDDNTTYVVMDLCYSDLNKFKQKNGRFEPFYVLKKMKEVAIGIKAIHDLGYAHRDIKPENIFIAKNFQGEDVFKIGDFGLGKSQEALVSKVGTICYMAPDMLDFNQIEYTKSVDIWALGVMMHELLTGCILFYGQTSEIVRNKIMQSKQYKTWYNDSKLNIQQLDFISQSFQYIKNENIVSLIDALLNKNPKQRINIDEVINRLNQNIIIEEQNQINYQQGQQQFQMNQNIQMNQNNQMNQANGQQFQFQQYNNNTPQQYQNQQYQYNQNQNQQQFMNPQNNQQQVIQSEKANAQKQDNEGLKKELKIQEELLEKKIQKINEQKKEIAEKQKENEDQKKQLIEQKKEITDKNTKIENLEKKLNEYENIIREQNKKMNKREQEYKGQEDLVKYFKIKNYSIPNNNNKIEIHSNQTIKLLSYHEVSQSYYLQKIKIEKKEQKNLIEILNKND